MFLGPSLLGLTFYSNSSELDESQDSDFEPAIEICSQRSSQASSTPLEQNANAFVERSASKVMNDRYCIPMYKVLFTF